MATTMTRPTKENVAGMGALPSLMMLCFWVSIAGCAKIALDMHDGPASADASAALDMAGAPPADLSKPAATDDLTLPVDLYVAPDLRSFVCYGMGSTFPNYARTCGMNTDCVVAIHQIDCCGSHSATGMSATAQQGFNASEANFRKFCPSNCNCMPKATVCDDGKTAPEQQIRITCDNGVCVTHGL